MTLMNANTLTVSFVLPEVQQDEVLVLQVGGE